MWWWGGGGFNRGFAFFCSGCSGLQCISDALPTAMIVSCSLVESSNRDNSEFQLKEFTLPPHP